MKEWIIENTNVSEDEYDKLLNYDTVSIEGKCNNKNNTFSDNPIVNIAIFTLNKPSYKQRKKFKIIKEKDANKKTYYKYLTIKFYILTDFLKQYQEELHKTNRHRQCFHLNSKICISLNTNSYLITAMCKSPYTKRNIDYIHTFILIITNDNKEYIIDATANIIMDKETYFNIFNPQIISCIKKEQLQEDLNLIEPLETQNLLYKAEYFCFPNKIINSIKKRNT